MPTFFAAVLSAGLSVKFAYLVQGTVMLLVFIGLAWGWRKYFPALARDNSGFGNTIVYSLRGRL